MAIFTGNIIKKLSDNAIVLSGFIENNLEKDLNSIINNKFNVSDLEIELNDIKDNLVTELNNEIHKLIISIITNEGLKQSKDKNKLCIYENVLKFSPFCNSMQNIYTLNLLIRLNIKNIAQYPVLKKQSYIPELALMISSIVKNTIDTFYSLLNFNNNNYELYGNKINNKAYKQQIIKKTWQDIKNIDYVCDRTINDLSGIKSNIYEYDAKNQMIYYSLIVSYLKEIAIFSYRIIENAVA
ncbi:MAG: hypothetical protein EVG15_01470 [Candidatus Acididesulfobacter diazotrophicus]|jgi:hypothetical protein|uniref:Uncharacterized protein n=1 Tax=Candidatus Acididesulfobacter diazotrophicus TaxID=2597226 RepID=A0A519BQM5_9DELT|nr:MAG: hypothetical protein EVG15_01470 [Candidatus Acididesulfobacter diazotrophicus]